MKCEVKMFSIRGANILILNKESGEQTRKIAVKTDRVTIGAHPLNSIRLHTLEAERLHCKLFADSSNSVTIHNFSVRNPVLLNGVRLEGKTVIQNGDKFEVAGYLFEWNYNPANINAVRKSTKRATCLPSVGKPKTLKRVRSFGELVKQCSVKVPRDVGLMLNAIRKRRTIHSIIVPSLNRSPESDGTHENVHLTDNTHAQADTTMQMELNAANPVANPNEISTIEKENVTLRHEIPKLQTTGVMLTSYVSLAEKRHLTCKTPVASPKRTPLRHKNATFDKTEIEEYLVNVSNPHDSMHLIDLTTPVKSQPTSAVRKIFSGKVAQSPRVLDAINLISPSPKKVNRTPNSVKAVAPSTPKVALLKSAIKNSRIHASDTKKTPLASSLSNKKTPNVKINSSVRTDPHKVTPISSKTSAVKLRKHLISSLNKKDSSDTPVPIVTAEAPKDPNTTPIPIVTTETLSKHSTPVPESIPRDQQSLQSVIPEYKDEIIANVADTGVEDTAVVIPMFDVQSVIKKPNRTTQIRSAKYSDVTPHESFMDGVTPAVVPPEENALVLHADINEPVRSNTLNEELKNVNDLPTCTRLKRNSCLPISTAQLTPQPTKSRKTFSALDYNSLSVSPMSRVSIPEDPIIDLDLDSELSSLDDHVNEDELLASSDSEPVHDIEILPAKVSTPQLRDSLRDTRKFIGSAFTSLNTSRPQLDLTAEIDESLLINEEEEPDHGNNEKYNMQAAHESELPNEQIISNALVVSDDTATPMETKPKSSSASILSNSMRECFSSKHSKINDNRRNTLSTAVLQDSSRGLTKEDINCVSQYMETTPSEEEPKHFSDISVHEQLQPVDADLDDSKNMLNPAADSNQLSPNYSLKIITKTPTRLPESANEHVSETKMLLSTPKIADGYIQENREKMFSTPKAIESTEGGCDRVSTCINLIGVKEMLKTPKVSHSDVNYCHAMENMFRTPKSVVSSETEKENSCGNVECNEELHNTLPEGQSDGQDCEEIQHNINAEPTSPSAELVGIDKMKELSSTPKSISFADADQNDSSCIDLEDSVDPLSSAVDIEGNRQVEEIPSTPKPISAIDEDQNELSCEDRVDAEEVELQELNRTPTPISSIDVDKNESVCIELAVGDDSLLAAATVEDTCEVEKIPDEQPSASTCTDLADVVEDVASTGNIEENDEENELNKTPKEILSMQVEIKKHNCVNLVGVKELLKTPKKCNVDDADYRELQDMFKTPKPSSRITAKGSESCVSLVGVKELLKTPKNIDMDASNLSAIQNMLKTPKPVSCDDADSNESVCAEVIDIAASVSPTNQEENNEIKKLIRTPQSISCADADQNELSCIDLEGSVDPLPSAVDVEGNRQVEEIPSTPKPISAIDEDQNELSCEDRVDAEEVELQELNRTPKPISTIDEDQNESIELAVADDPVSPAATVEDTCEVEQIFDEKPNASTCTDLADVVEDVASTGNIEENDEVNELNRTPKEILSMQVENEKHNCVNLVGVKELLKTPKKCNVDDADYRELQDMFKTPKPSSRITAKGSEICVNLVGIKELLKTPKNIDMDASNLSAIQNMLKTPKPVSCDDADSNESVCAVVEHVEEEPGSPCADIDDNCKVEAIPKTPKAQSASVLDQNKSTCVDISNDVQPASPSTDIEHHVEVETKELLQTPNLTRQSGKQDQNCGNLVGVKELLKTPKNSNVDDADYRELQDMFKTPKPCKPAISGKAEDPIVNLVGVKELLKTPKTTHKETQDSIAMQNMFKTPKPASCDDADSNESTSAEMTDIAAPVSSTNQEENNEIKKLIRTPQSISCADADQNELSCIDLEDSVDPLPSAVDIEGNRQVEEIPNTPKPISAIDEAQNELSCEDRVDAEEVELQELNRTPKPISTIDEDQNQSIELAVADDPVSPADTVEDTCEVEQIFDEKPNASTCTDLADVVEDVASTGNIEENDEVNELNRTPKAILSMKVENEKQNCVNLVGVKELLKTPKNCNADDADYRELQDMFKTPKPSSRITAKGSETCVSLVGVKELLKTPKNIDMDASNLSAIQNMLKTPKPVSCDDADSNESVCAVVEHVEEPGSPCADIDDNCKVEAIPKTPKAQSASVLDQNKSTCVDISNDVQPASPSTDIEHHVEVEAKELLQTPNLTRQSGKEDQNCGNLVGVKELLKTPKNSNIDDADYRELQDMFKTPKPCKPAISGKAEDPIVNLVGVKELLKTPKTTHKETQDSIAMQNMFKTPKATSSVETSTDKAESSFVNLVGVKELLKTPKNSVTETQDLSDMPDMFKTPKPIAANKLDNKKSVKHDDSGKESVEMAKEETKLDPATPTRTMRKRKLYSRKDEELKTPDNLTAPSPQRGVSDAEYLNILKLPVAKENILTEKFSESPARRDMPKRTCRQKIESLSEEVLAGKSPAPKYCKPPAQKEDAATPNIKEEVDALLTIRRVGFNEVVNVKEFNSPNIVGDVIKNVKRQPRGRKRITEAHDSLNSSEEATEQVVENVKRKRGRPAMVKENLEQQKAVATGGSQRITESNATSESEDLVSDQQSSDVTNEDMGLVDTETKEKNEDEQPTDVAGIEQKLPRRRQQTKGLKSASATKHILSEESVNENDTPVKKRGRTQKKASEVDVLAETSNSTPLRRGRPKKALQIVEETASTDNQNNETDKLAQDETKSVDEKANVEVNNVTESGKEEQDIVKPVVKGRRRKIEAHKEENTGHKSAETVQEATKPASRGRRRKVEEPQEKELEKEVSETVQDEPKVVGRGRRRKIEVHNEDEAVKEDVVAVAQQTTKPVARGRRRKMEEQNDEELSEKVTEDVQDSSKSVDKTPQRNTEVCVEEDSAKVDVAVAQNETKPVRKGGRRKQELIKAEDTESEDASVIKDEVKPVGKGRRRKVEVQTKEEPTEVKAVKGRRRKIEVPAEEAEVEEKHEPSETPKRGKSETVVVSGSQQDTGEQKYDQETSAKTTTKAKKTAKKDEASNTDDSVAVENAADSSPKTETRPVRRTRAKRN
uniref:FHA domain-containing protein n=1 Tax=Anopheles gambiae TaxID=7165 RepID=A0A1S4GIH4_ANOGA